MTTREIQINSSDTGELIFGLELHEMVPEEVATDLVYVLAEKLDRALGNIGLEATVETMFPHPEVPQEPLSATNNEAGN